MLGGNRNAGAIILKIAYGYTIEPHGTDPLVDLADRAVSQFSAASQPGIWLVDIIPFRVLFHYIDILIPIVTESPTYLTQ